MKKLIRLYSVALLVFLSTAVYANVTPLQAVMKCQSKSGETLLQPYSNGTVNVAATGEFLPTDKNGYFYLNNYQGDYIKIYLAKESTIIVDCRSRLTLVKNGTVILGERGSSCAC